MAVTGHLARCAECQLMLEQLRLLGSTLQASLKGRAWLSHEEAAAFTGAVVGRLEAERQASVFLRARLLLDDMHVVYACLGAAVATLACVAVVLTMMRVSTDERPDSLARPGMALVHRTDDALEILVLCDDTVPIGFQQPESRRHIFSHGIRFIVPLRCARISSGFGLLYS